jgi:predicted permease
MSNPRSFVSSLGRAWRSLRRRPGFFAIAVSSLAVALGLATTVIAQIDSLMHPYTPVKDAHHTYQVVQVGVGTGNRRPAPEDVSAALRSSGLFDAIATVNYRSGQIEIGPGVVGADIMLANRDFFDISGFVPRLGRVFAPGESLESGVAIVGDQFWRRYFNNAASINGATFTFENRVYRVVGVSDGGWEQVNAGVWVPRPLSSDGRRIRETHIARLKPGYTRKNADAVLTQIAARWVTQLGVSRWRIRFYVSSLEPDPLRLQGFQKAMIGAALFILLIGSANVSALMLAHSVVKRRDHALRLALGAKRADLMRDVTAELVILTAAGAIAGIVIAYAAMGLMTALTPPELGWLGFTKPNWNPRVFTGLLVAMISCVTFASMLPAWYVTRIAPAEPLKESSGTTTGRAGSRFQLFVIGELALSMILLFGASLISKAAFKVAAFDFGYEARNVTAVSSNTAVVGKLSPPIPPDSLVATNGRRAHTEIVAADLDRIVDRLRALREVRDAAWFAIDGADRGIVISQSSILTDSMLFNPPIYNVGPGFLRTLGIPVVAGRDFTEGDRAGRGSIILDRRAAARLFPDGSAIGRLVKLGRAQSPEPWLPVVGVAGNAVHHLPEYPELEPPPVIYVSRQKSNGFFPSFAYRAARGTTDISPVAMRTVRDALPPHASVFAERWVESYEELLTGQRFIAGIFAALSLASLVLATAGLFGVLLYAVNERMREFSLRVALGAQRRDVLRLVLRDGFVMALGGTAIGAFVGMYAGFVVYDSLWGVYPVDAPALVVAELILLAVTAAASAIPALRATRANPSDVLRSI